MLSELLLLSALISSAYDTGHVVVCYDPKTYEQNEIRYAFMANDDISRARASVIVNTIARANKCSKLEHFYMTYKFADQCRPSVELGINRAIELLKKENKKVLVLGWCSFGSGSRKINYEKTSPGDK